MAFNANTYHANKCSREARSLMDRARGAKAREMQGEPSDLETQRSAFLAKSALTYSRLARTYRALGQIGRSP